MFRRLCVIVILLLAALAPLHAAPPAPAAPREQQEILTLAVVDKALAQTQKELDALPPPKDKDEKSPDGQRRALLKTRLAGWQGARESLLRIQEMEATLKGLPAQERQVGNEINQLQTMTALKPPEHPTPDGLLQAQEALLRATQEMDALQLRIKERQQLLQELPQRLVTVREARQTAEDEVRTFQEMAAKEAADTRALLVMQADNARLRARAATLEEELLRREQELEKKDGPLRDKEVTLAQARRQRAEGAFTLYQQALNQQQAVALRDAESTLKVKEEAAAQAVTPDTRFLARWEAEITRVQKQIADLQQLKTGLIALLSDEERRLAAEREELKNLENLFGHQGRRELASEILQEIFQRLKARGNALGDGPPRDLIAKLDGLQTRRFAIDATLYSLEEKWRQEQADLLNQLPPEQRNPFTLRATPLVDQFRRLLGEEKRMLFEVETEEQRFRMVHIERRGVFNDLDGFVRARVFWIRDAPPLNLAVGGGLFEELFGWERPFSLLNWSARLLSRETAEQLLVAFQQLIILVLGGVLLILAPVAGGYYRRRLRLIQSRVGERLANPRLPLGQRLAPVLASLLGLSLLPIYLALLALSIDLLALPAAIGAVVERVLTHVALFAFFWRVNRLLLGEGRVAEHLFRLPAEVAGNLHRALRIALLAWLVCLLPWMIFRSEPFLFEALPRLGYTLFEVAMALALYLLIRPAAPLVRHTFGEEQRHLPLTGLSARQWPLVSRGLTLFMAGVVGLDMAGYRFGAEQLARNGLLTLLTLFLLSGLYVAASAMLEGFIRSRRRLDIRAPGERSQESRKESVRRLLKSMRVLALLAGVLVLAAIWNIDEGAMNLLHGQTLYSTTGPGGKLEVVTLGDMFSFVLTLIIIFWLLRHLPEILEFLFFSRLALDTGVRYAVVTIARYVVFLVGVFTSLGYLRFDLSQVGWLVAAISVGLGFGLQEIVANFVSGIILLVERPIRVGDIISVGGNVQGRVTRINIRSTTVLNADQQERLIPNRDLITKEVTNWTLGNTIVRVVIPIGVAYGSDVDLVRELLLGIAREQPEVLKDPPPEAFFLLHAESSLNFELRVYVGDPSQRTLMVDRLNTLISKRFVAHNIQIPFPQREVRVVQGTSALSPEDAARM